MIAVGGFRKGEGSGRRGRGGVQYNLALFK